MFVIKSFVIILYISFSFANKQDFKHKPEQGIFHVSLREDSQPAVFKTLYKNSTISVQYNTTSTKCTSKETFVLHVILFGASCKGEFQNDPQHLRDCVQNPELCTTKHFGKKFIATADVKCQTTGTVNFIGNWTKLPLFNETKAKSEKLETLPSPQHRKKRDNNSTNHLNKVDDASKPAASESEIQVLFMGQYIVVLSLYSKEYSKASAGAYADLIIKMKTPLGYLSADEYPLLTFYIIMCVVYSLYCLFWLLTSACNFRELLRIQYWIGAVIVLGLIEKIVYYVEYANVNETGLSNREMEKFAGFVACLKRALTRMLVIIVSLGFGIVKPRLGPNLYRVLGIGVIYFIVALLVQMLEIDVYFDSGSREALLLMYVPLVVIDILICWWIFKSLLETMKTLRLRRNTTKLSLYRHFANTIVLCALVSVAMMIYIIYYHELGCSEEFANDWFETACWPLLFSIILLVIIVLWRPSANNQRYAYSPMVDGNDSDEEDANEPMLGNGATENMKARGTKTTEFMKSDVDSAEENLKWIDENIPETVADAALPALMDADEVKKATKYEMSKMD